MSVIIFLSEKGTLTSATARDGHMDKIILSKHSRFSIVMSSKVCHVCSKCVIHPLK